MEFENKFVELLEAAAGGAVPHVLEALREPAVTAIRVNPLKVKTPAATINILNSLTSENPDSELPNTSYTIVPWCPDGYILKQRPVFTLDPAFHSGAYYVQEPSSMALELVRPLLQKLQEVKNSPINILDIAASPGGKTTHLISMKPEGSFMISNEVIRSRVGALIENIVKWGDHEIVITNNDPSDFTGLTSFFDFILADVPCSGEGMFRKTTDKKIVPVALAEWSVQNVEVCRLRQRRIISDIWPTLASGGILVYSTCTFNNRENDENIQWIKESLGAEILDFKDFTDVSVLKEAGVRISSAGGLRFFPGEVVGEGFFLAVMRKPYVKEDTFGKNQFEKYARKLKIINYKSAEKSTQPPHESALSIKYSNEYPSIELSRQNALLFLSKGNLTPLAISSQPLSKGYYRVTYEGNGLGFIKFLENRVNNLFPIERRIRMQI